ncbi:hypothetical protein NDU88_000614 [Pleurodeles waltl]|uniref:Uncharacterized protein n=1 Tax=Pleurodeles waltl TaxID=8319 RepID=A0AAV7UQH2_PLEWA|nr:hypothetical protein NDU88_000614 [Pleurodeles waltl]
MNQEKERSEERRSRVEREQIGAREQSDKKEWSGEKKQSEEREWSKEKEQRRETKEESRTLHANFPAAFKEERACTRYTEFPRGDWYWNQEGY